MLLFSKFILIVVSHAVLKLLKLFFVFVFFIKGLFALSLWGTFQGGYLFSVHLLNIVNNNEMLKQVIRAVTQNGR